jgi:hypothetical protein
VKQPLTFNQFISMIKTSEYLSEFADENGVGVRGKGDREIE